jgi:hypothetical protein
VTSALLSHTLADVHARARRTWRRRWPESDRRCGPALGCRRGGVDWVHDPRVPVDVSPVAWAFGSWALLSCLRASFWGEDEQGGHDPPYNMNAACSWDHVLLEQEHGRLVQQMMSAIVALSDVH